jgi:hypothetical protein
MKTTLPLLSLLPLALAVPTVTPIPTGRTDCLDWPGWINSRPNDLTSSLMFTVSQSDDSAVNGLPLQQFSVPWGSGNRNFLGATLLASRSFAKAYYRCINGVPVVMSNTDQPISIAKDMNNAHLLIAAPAAKAYRAEIFEHEVDGVKQDGWYLGAQNQTTWGFHYQEATCGADGKVNNGFYQVKLLGLPVDPENEPTAGYPTEFKGFLKVDLW